MAEMVARVEHGVVASMPDERLGYFGWPSVARMDDGTLVVASSGMRTKHVCAWGKTVLHFSGDEGRTWSAGRVLNDTPLDDRDAGVISLGGRRLLVAWFTSDTRQYLASFTSKCEDPEELARWQKVLGGWTDELVDKWLGSWVRVSEDGQTFSPAVRVPASAPHGPIVLRDGNLLYLGKQSDRLHGDGAVQAFKSLDRGTTWQPLGVVPMPADSFTGNFHEPHALDLGGGRLLGMIRYQHRQGRNAYDNFSLFQTESSDGGKTWSQARPTGVLGSPPHLIGHSSGAIVCVYGYRFQPFGQRAIVSRDGGRTWPVSLIIRDDGPDHDLGYPCSIELPGGDIFTVYYQKPAAGKKCALLWSRWRLP